MTHAIERSRQTQQELATRTKELTLDMVVEMTGYSLPQVAMIRHNMALSMSMPPDRVPLYDIALFCHSAKVLHLDPLLRQAYWISRQGKGTLQVGIDGYRAIADRSGIYAGSEAPSFRGTIEWTFVIKGKETRKVVPEKASVTVWKVVAGHKCAFTGEARWEEFCPKGDQAHMYLQMPTHMLAKDAEAQALRKAFPALLASVEYAEAEPSDGDLPEVAAPPQVVVEPRLQVRPSVTAADYDRIFGDDGRGGHDEPDVVPYEEAGPEENPPVVTASDSPRAGGGSAAPASTGGAQSTPAATSATAGQAAPSPHLARNRKLLADARQLNVKGLGHLTADELWPTDKVEAANRELEARIRSRNGDEQIAATQDRVL